MSEQDYEQLTLFREDFPASRFPWLESKKVRQTTVTCGRKCSELSESLRRVGSWVRTYLESCALPPGTRSRTWSVKGMTSRCLILKLRLSARCTDGNGSSSSGAGDTLWNTPSAMDSLPPRSMDAVRRQATTTGKGRTQPATLREQVIPEYRNAYQSARLWPTPAARDYKGSNSMEHLTRESGNMNHTGQLANAVRLWPKLKDAGLISEEERRNLSQGNGGQLNPTWVEWLMGFPIGYTEVE